MTVKNTRWALKLAAGLVLAAACLSHASPAWAVGNYANAAIADKALTYLGQWGGNACHDAQKPGDSGGQCKAFVNCIVWMVSGGTQNLGGSDYFQPYLDAGGIEIKDINDLAKGDIVQVGQGVHTYIIVSHVSGNTFTVVDSNRNYDEMVTSYDRTVTLDSTSRAFRLGMGGGDGGSGTLFFIKTKNASSGHVEIHSAMPQLWYQDGQHSITYFLPSDADNGWFQMAGLDLYFIKTKNVSSGRVEVHSATAASGYKSGIHYATAFRPVDANNGWFQMDDVNRDGVQDLVFIKTRNTASGRVEFFVADGAKKYGQITIAKATAFRPVDANNGWFQAQGPDLVFVKTRNTDSGSVEYFRATAASGYARIPVATPTYLSLYEQNNGWFSIEDTDFDALPDVLYIKTHDTVFNHVEIFDIEGDDAYQQLSGFAMTYFSTSDADNGWFQINSKQ